MTTKRINLVTWPANDLAATLVAVAILLVLQSTMLTGIFSTPAAYAGCAGAVVVRYLHQCGYRITDGTWRVRLALLIIGVLAVAAGGFIAILLGSK